MSGKVVSHSDYVTDAGLLPAFGPSIHNNQAEKALEKSISLENTFEREMIHY